MMTRALCLALLLPWAIACSDSDRDTEPGPTPLERELTARIDQAAASGFSGAALITIGGEPAHSSAHGLANRDAGVQNTLHTAFDVGSIVKLFTATAIYALEEDGELAVSDPLSSFFSDVPADKADITLLQVIGHSAGFDEYHDTEGDFEDMTRDEARARIFAKELLFEPGTEVAYSNSGYTLLAQVIENVSGEEYTDYVRDRLLSRAGMTESGFYSDPLWQTVQTATGYESEDTFGENDPASWPYTWALVGNGGLVASVLDLDRWLTALPAGEVVSAQTFAKLESEHLATEPYPIAGEDAYIAAGAGDFGLGGVVFEVPSKGIRLILASNTYFTFDIEIFGLELTAFLIERTP